MPEILYTRPFLYEYQREILDSPSRYTITEAATKTGKTASHIIWLLEQALNPALKPGSSVWWVAPIYGQAEIAFKRMKNQMTDKEFFKSNESKLMLTLPTGVQIQFKSAERPDSLYGDDVYAAVFDEFTRAREDSWFALRSTLTATNAKCKFIGNVKGKNNWGYKMAQRAKNGEQDYKHFKITAYDAVKVGLLKEEEIEAAKRDLPESVFNELYLAEASEDGSNPFGYKYIQQCTYPMSTMPPICFGIDLAKSVDHTVIIGLDQNKNVCYFDRFQKGWKETVETIMLLPDVPIKIDSTGVGDPIAESIQRERNNVTGFKFSSTSKQQIMEGLAMAIQKREISFPEGPIKNELEDMEFEHTRTGVKYSAPPGLHDDCVCALALANDQHASSVNAGQYAWI